jgi:hypothetical protein
MKIEKNGGPERSALRLLAILTLANLALLAYLLSQVQPAFGFAQARAFDSVQAQTLDSAQARAGAQSVAPVVRAQALEIVDKQGRLRATLNIQPASKHDGQTYPETVLLRLIDPNGKPIVTLGGAVGSAGLGLNDGSDTTYALIEAKDADAYVRLTTTAGGRQIIRP